MNRSLLTLRKQVDELKEQKSFTRRSAVTYLLESLIMEQNQNQNTEVEDEDHSSTGDEGDGNA